MGILRAVCTSGLILLSLLSTPTPVRLNLLCPVLWTHCLLWTGARTCCLFPSSLSRSPLTRFSLIGLPPTPLQLPGRTSHLNPKEGGEEGQDMEILCEPCYYSTSFLIFVYFQYFLFVSGPLGIGGWMGNSCPRTVLHYRRAPPVDAEILRTMKKVGFIGYAPNPRTRLRNQVCFGGLVGRGGRGGWRWSALTPAHWCFAIFFL